METPFSVCTQSCLVVFALSSVIVICKEIGFMSLITYHEQLAKAPDGNGGVYAGMFTKF